MEKSEYPEEPHRSLRRRLFVAGLVLSLSGVVVVCFASLWIPAGFILAASVANKLAVKDKKPPDNSS